MNVHPLLELVRDIVIRVPLGILPINTSGILFWVVMLLVWMQYRRLAKMEKQIHGFILNNPVKSTATAGLYGILGGVVGSIVLVFMGVVLFQQDILYLWPAALLLMFINPRYLCFSYAAGLLAIGHLTIGFPAEMNVAGIMALVAVLHLMEGMLVLFSGDAVATPVYIREDRQVIGAFLLQRFWPIPIMIIFFLQISPEIAAEGINMPQWWPLIEVSAPSGENWARILTPVVAALGYSDISISDAPARRAKQSAFHLWIFSLILLMLSWLMTLWRPLTWLAALFSPLGHEAMIMYGNRKQRQSAPKYLGDAEGVDIMDVKEGGVADHLGLRPGDRVLSVNGEHIARRKELRSTIKEYSGRLNLAVVRNNEPILLQGVIRGEELLEIVTLPQPGDREQVDLGKSGLLSRAWDKLKSRLKN